MMDINTIIESYFGKSSPTREMSFKNTTSGKSQTIPKWQKEAVLAVKKDPAVLEAKVSMKNQGIPISQNASQVPKKPYGPPAQDTPKPKLSLDFDSMMCMEQATLLSLPSSQLSLILKYVDIMRQQRMSMQKKIECAFCKNNKQREVWYTTHVLKDSKGRVRCPVLRSFVCPRCGATGDRAHTIKHCPYSWRY